MFIIKILPKFEAVKKDRHFSDTLVKTVRLLLNHVKSNGENAYEKYQERNKYNECYEQSYFITMND